MTIPTTMMTDSGMKANMIFIEGLLKSFIVTRAINNACKEKHGLWDEKVTVFLSIYFFVYILFVYSPQFRTTIVKGK